MLVVLLVLVKCSTCGKQHDVLDPAFRRPDAVHSIPSELRAGNVMESDDLCAIRAQDSAQLDRYLVRCILPVRIVDHDGELTQWGLWAEVSAAVSKVTYDRWDDPDQATQPPLEGVLANNIPGYLATIGLPVRIQMNDPKSRPTLELAADAAHPFATECRNGVTIDRVLAWLSNMG